MLGISWNHGARGLQLPGMLPQKWSWVPSSPTRCIGLLTSQSVIKSGCEGTDLFGAARPLRWIFGPWVASSTSPGAEIFRRVGYTWSTPHKCCCRRVVLLQGVGWQWCMYVCICIYIHIIYIYIWIWLRCMEHLAVAAARCLSERLHSMLNQSQGLRLAIISIHSARLICVDEMGQHTPTMAIECILVLWCKTSDFGVFNFQTYKTMHKKTSAFVSLICLFSWRHCRTCNNQIVQKLPSFVYLSMMNDPHELPHGVVALMQMNPLGTWCSSGSRMLTTSSLRTWIGRCHQIQLLPELSIVDEQPLLGQAQMLTEAAGPMVRENIGGRDFNWIQPDGSKRIPKVRWPIESMFRWFTTNFREHRMAKIYMVDYG